MDKEHKEKDDLIVTLTNIFGRQKIVHDDSWLSMNSDMKSILNMDSIIMLSIIKKSYFIRSMLYHLINCNCNNQSKLYQFLGEKIIKSEMFLVKMNKDKDRNFHILTVNKDRGLLLVTNKQIKHFKEIFTMVYYFLKTKKKLSKTLIYYLFTIFLVGDGLIIN